MKGIRPRKALRTMATRARDLRGRFLYRLGGPILIYQMGKVGSSAVYRALRESGLGVPIHQVHLLNNLDEIERHVRRLYDRPEETLRQIERGRRLRQDIDREPRRRWDVVTIVRDPVARNISAFFQSIEEILPDLRTSLGKGRVDIALLLDAFLERFDHGAPTGWFDTQMKPVFDLDVFSAPFPHERGFQTLEGDRARLLILRTRDLPRCFSTAFRDFLDVPVKRPSPENSAAGKWYGSLYERFLAEASLPQEYVATQYESKMARHFFTSDEISRMWTHWSSRVEPRL